MYATAVSISCTLRGLRVECKKGPKTHLFCKEEIIYLSTLLVYGVEGCTYSTRGDKLHTDVNCHLSDLPQLVTDLLMIARYTGRLFRGKGFVF